MLIETLICGAAAAGWFSFQYAWWRPAIDWRRPRVLMYHMVSPARKGARFNKLRVDPRSFRRQLDWLSRHRFTFVFASQLAHEAPLPKRSVCLTFDDGYLDNLTNADPILAEFNARATLYLVGDRSGGWSSKKKTHHGDEELASEPKLDDEQVRQMVSSGRWELGGHTQSHANLIAVDDETARREINWGREEFAACFGQGPATFAYPFGLFQPAHAEMVQASGYLAAVTTEAGIAPHPAPDPWRIPRIKVSGRDNLLAFVMRMRSGQRGLLR